MAHSVSPNRRKELDVMKLMMSDFQVAQTDSISNLVVTFYGPKDSAYEGGVWKVRIFIPDAYPYKSPSIGFINKIFHPNVDERSGSVCLDVINQAWSPMYDLKNVFETFLPQLLLYPNPTDPLNSSAASMLMRSPEKYRSTVKEYIEKYARDMETAEAQVGEDEGLKRGRSDAADAHAEDSSSSDEEEVDTSNIPDI